MFEEHAPQRPGNGHERSLIPGSAFLNPAIRGYPRRLWIMERIASSLAGKSRIATSRISSYERATHANRERFPK